MTTKKRGNSSRSVAHKTPRKTQLSAVSIQHLRTLADQIGAIIPATAFGNGSFSFQAIAKQAGLAKVWPRGSKKESIFGFLKSVYKDHRKIFYRVFRENIARGIERRHKMGNPVLEAEMLAIDNTLRALGVNLSKEFSALHLPKERPKIVPPPTAFQRMIDELGLHPLLLPECPKLFKDGHVNEAVRKSLEKYERYVQQRAGLTIIGSNLMATAFSESTPRLVVADISTTRGKGLQNGFKLLSMGAMEYWRNFCSHGDEDQMPHHDAMAILSAVSHLLFSIENKFKESAT